MKDYHPGDCFEFYVNVDPQHFLSWLQEVVRDPDYNRLTTENRRMNDAFDFASVLFQIGEAVVVGSTKTGAITATIQAIWPSGSAEEAVDLWLVSPAPGRTRVKVCRDPEYGGYVGFLADKLRLAYPEVDAQARAELEQDELLMWRATLIGLARERDEDREWPEFPWSANVPLALEDVVAACFEHLERLSGKRFPVEWDVNVWSTVEKEGISIRYEIQSGHAERRGDEVIRSPGKHPVGTVRLRRIRENQTQLKIAPFLYGEAADTVRLREIIRVFAGRWLAELVEAAEAGNPVSKRNNQIVNRSQRLQLLQQESKDFLLLLADRANFNPSDEVTMRDIVDEMGLSEERAFELEDYLEGRGWLKRKTMGGIDGGLSMTALGVEMVEKWFQEDAEAEEHRPTLREETEPVVTGKANMVDTRPWELIPDNSWDREAVRNLWRGMSTPEIASALNLSTKTVDNRLSVLRKIYPEQVPTREELRVHLRPKH